MFVVSGFVDVELAGAGIIDAGQPRAAALDDAILLDTGGQGACLRRREPPVASWDGLAEQLQVIVADAALRRAAALIAFQAEMLAREMEAGALPDRGGPDALRLLAAVVRVTGEEGLGSHKLVKTFPPGEPG